MNWTSAGPPRCVDQGRDDPTVAADPSGSPSRPVHSPVTANDPTPSPGHCDHVQAGQPGRRSQNGRSSNPSRGGTRRPRDNCPNPTVEGAAERM